MVLVRPQMGENIGAAARAMLNFGLDRMRIVAPRDGWPNPAAVAMASGAGRVLDAAVVRDDLAGAISDCTHVYATTARPRGLIKEVVAPEAAMADAAARISAGQRVAFLFGPERAGLENADIAEANSIVSVPVDPGFASLNLAQCVLLLSYEWARAKGAMPPPGEDAPLATQAETGALYAHLDRLLTGAHFFFPEHKAPSMRTNLRNLISRMPLTGGDVRIIHGALKALMRRR